jgi:hypothetical protein
MDSLSGSQIGHLTRYPRIHLVDSGLVEVKYPQKTGSVSVVKILVFLDLEQN